jgi:hypothetical protein
MFTTLVATVATVAALHGAPVHDSTLRMNVEDTTSVVTNQLDPTYGYVWAHDTIVWNATATPVAGQPGTYDVKISEDGLYNANANPITGANWNGVGLFGGSIDYVVSAPNAPTGHLKIVEPGTEHTMDLIDQMFAQPDGSSSVQVVGGGNYSFTYYGIPGATNGVYTQVG